MNEAGNYHHPTQQEDQEENQQSHEDSSDPKIQAASVQNANNINDSSQPIPGNSAVPSMPIRNIDKEESNEEEEAYFQRTASGKKIPSTTSASHRFNKKEPTNDSLSRMAKTNPSSGQQTLLSSPSDSCPCTSTTSSYPEEPDIEIPVTSSLDDALPSDTENPTTSTNTTSTSSAQTILSEPASPGDATDEAGAEDTVENITIASAPALQFPPPFYCPLTHQLFLDPVVAPDGLSYERNVLLPDLVLSCNRNLPKPQVYPNRALQQIMEDYLDLNGDTWDAGIRRFRKAIETGIQQLWDRSLWRSTSSSAAAGFGVDRPLPDAYYCPITFDLLHVPVIDPEGNTYEKAAIVSWIQANGNSPLSRSPLTIYDLYPNHAIRQLLEFYANDDQNADGTRRSTPIPAALLQWKTELPPVLPQANEHGLHHQQQQQQEGSSPYVIPSHPNPYPVTLEQLEEYHLRIMRQRRKVFVFTIVGIVCFVLALVLAFLYGGYCIFLSLWVGCCVRDSIRHLRELQQEHVQGEQVEQERLADTQSRIQNLQHRLLLMQQQLNPNNNESNNDATINNDNTNTASSSITIPNQEVILWNQEETAELGGNNENDNDTTINNDNTIPAVSSSITVPNQEVPWWNQEETAELGGDAPESITLSAEQRRIRLHQLEQQLSQLHVEVFNAELAQRQERHQEWLGRHRERLGQWEQQQQQQQQPLDLEEGSATTPNNTNTESSSTSHSENHLERL